MAKKKELPLPESLGLPCVGVESHAHLDLDAFADDFPDVLGRAQRSGVAQIGNVFLSTEAYYTKRHIFDTYPQVFFLLGIHPCHAQECDASALAAMEEALRADSRFRAVGEIGFDYYWDDCPKDIQDAAFRAQLAMARRLELPVVIHSRDAADATITVLEEEGFTHYPVLWHCFGGDVTLASRILSHGWHLSIPGTVTYPANAALREAVRYIPLDRMLLETDCPYLSPQPYRGKRNEPAYTVFSASCIAQERGMDAAELWQACGDTARRFFGM